MIKLAIALALVGCTLDYEPDIGPLQSRADAGALDPDGAVFVPGLCGERAAGMKITRSSFNCSIASGARIRCP